MRIWNIYEILERLGIFQNYQIMIEPLERQRIDLPQFHRSQPPKQLIDIAWFRNLVGAAIDQVAHAGKELCIGAERRRLIDIFGRAQKPLLACLTGATGLTIAHRGTKVAGKAPMSEYRCIQAESLEHLAHISPSVVCVVDVGQDLPHAKSIS
jgi:hypothetical protein